MAMILEADKQSILKVGQKYLVWHARCIFDKTLPQDYIIPIFPLLHKDPAFMENAVHHYHIDGRFPIPRKIKNELQIVNGITNFPLWHPKKGEYVRSDLEVLEIFQKPAICVRLTTGINPPLESQYTRDRKTRYAHWYKTMVGKSCAGKKCPHYGTTMIDTGKHLVCPMHNLTADRETEIVIDIIPE